MALPAILFPIIEDWTAGYLSAALGARSELYAANVAVSTRTPSTRAARMVVIRRDGGPRIDAVQEAARLGITVSAGSDDDAKDLAQLVRALLDRAPSAPGPVTKARTFGPSPVNDESQQPTYYLTAELTVRGTPLT